MVITMDRYEADWGMVEKGWHTHVLGEGRGFSSAGEAVETLRAEHPGIGDQDLPPFVITDPDARSNAVPTIYTGDVDPDRLRGLAEAQAGRVLGVPLQGYDGQAFRIGHMGHLNPTMILGTLGSIEAVFVGMGVPLRRSGVAAAAAAIGPSITSP